MVEFFKIMLDMGNALYEASEGVLMGVIKDWKEYRYGVFTELVSVTNFSVSTFVSFFEVYIKGMREGFELLCELMKIVGVENFRDVFRGRVDLKSAIRVYQKSRELSDSAKFIESEVVENFKTSVENLSGKWVNLIRKMYSNFELIFKEEDPSKCVNLMVQIIESGVSFALGVWQTIKLTPLYERDWMNYSIEEIIESAEKFSEIKRDIDILAKCREKTFEHGVNCFIVILNTLWGSGKIARRKVEKIIRMFLPEEERAEGVKELKRVLEKVEALHLAAEWLRSPILQRLYETTIKRLEVKEKYEEKLLEILLELQKLTEKRESKNNR
ncbi:MAG: hypothetical protein ACTSRF_15180 [Candidatus Freyarchaeota archaeon]